MDFDGSFVTGLAVTGLGLLVAHWMPYPKRLHQTLNYAIGVSLILTGAAFWLLPTHWQTFLGFLALALIGGLATLAGYAWDLICNLIQRAKAIEDVRRND